MLPDFSLLLAGFTMLYALYFFDAPHRLFRDSDSGWHIRTGERILQSGTLPERDPYSFSKPGAPWIAWEWLADAAMGGLHRWRGLWAVAVWYLTLIAFASWLWVRLTWAAGGNFLLTCLFAAPLLTTVQLHWLARPHLLGWVCLLLLLLLLEKQREGWSVKGYFVLAALMTLWANVHASWFLAFPILAAYALARRGYWYALGISAIASLCNPYGWNLHWHVFTYLRDAELLQRIAEFQSFNFHTAGSAQVLLVLVISLWGAMAATISGRREHALILLLLSVIALRSARGLPVLALAGLPLANAALTAIMRPGPRWLRNALDYGDRLRIIDARLTGWPVLLLLVLLAASTPAAGFPESEFPAALAARAAALPRPVRLLAPDKYGGYLIYRFNGDVPVYFDGRSDFYGAAFMKEYIDLTDVRPGFEQTLAKYGFTHALLPVRYSLAAVLPLKGWKVLVKDNVAVLLERNL